MSDRMVDDARRFEEEDRNARERVEARNGLESYLYNLKNTMDDVGGSSGSKHINPEDKRDLEELIDDALDWLDRNENGDKDDFDEKQKEVEMVANPIMRQFYSGGESTVDEDDFEFEDVDL